MNLKSIIKSEKIKGAIAIAAAVIMFFTPDHIDLIIEALLAAFGIEKLVIKKEKTCSNTSCTPQQMAVTNKLLNAD